MSELSDTFYRAFEDRFRGSRELIRSRLIQYTPLLTTVAAGSIQRTALDLGCGRGEWLELLKENGFVASGCDLDSAMLAACRERNLEVYQIDALDALRGAPTASLSIVSGFHIAEHLPFSSLQALFVEATRTLEPGGVLILETPNPENVKVSSHTFHLDPTHQKPLPPALLAFMAEFYGFDHSNIVRLQEDSSIISAKRTTLHNVMFGTSPDYALIAQKVAATPNAEGSDNMLSSSFGIRDEELVNRFDCQQQLTSQNVENVSLELAAFHSNLQQIDKRISVMTTEIGILKEAIETDRLDRDAQQKIIEQIYSSSSWKITSPLRWLVAAVRKRLN